MKTITINEREITFKLPDIVGPKLVQKLRPALKAMSVNEVEGINSTIEVLCSKEDQDFINSLSSSEYIKAIPELAKGVQLLEEVMQEQEEKKSK